LNFSEKYKAAIVLKADGGAPCDGHGFEKDESGAPSRIATLGKAFYF
jgi:hypothetical protein